MKTLFRIVWTALGVGYTIQYAYWAVKLATSWVWAIDPPYIAPDWQLLSLLAATCFGANATYKQAIKYWPQLETY